MFSGRIGELVVILVIVLVLFGAGKLPKVMGDIGRGLRSFKDAVNDSTEKKKPEDE
jgi:sec-independent protein translocase protein TatA